MSEINSFKDLIVWQKAMIVAKESYNLTSKLPKDEIYGISSQIKRSAVSIASNIAEGHKRGSRKDYSQFLKIALGSAAELETQILLVSEIYKDVDTKILLDLLVEVEKMLSVIIKKLSVQPL